MHCQVWGWLCGSLGTWNCVCGCIGYIDPQASLATPSHPKPWWSVSGIVCQHPKAERKGPRPFPSSSHFLSCRNFSPPPPPAPTTLPKATSRLSWITTVKYYSVQFPIWPWLARIKLCMYFVWHRFYIVMMSYAKRKKN